MTPTCPRRRVLLGAAACLALVPGLVLSQASSLKIGILGTGYIGGALAERQGPKVRVGMPAEAAAFGEVVLISVPYGALPQVGRDYAQLLRGKVVLEAGNPFPGRDGEMAEPARVKGTGVASAGFEPVVVGGLVRARAFDAGSPVFGRVLTAHELRQALGLQP